MVLIGFGGWGGASYHSDRLLCLFCGLGEAVHFFAIELVSVLVRGEERDCSTQIGGRGGEVFQSFLSVSSEGERGVLLEEIGKFADVSFYADGHELPQAKKERLRRAALYKSVNERRTRTSREHQPPL